MWLCTRYGFFAVVRKTPNEFYVRARKERDLDNLKYAVLQRRSETKAERQAPELLATDFSTQSADGDDYTFRFIVSLEGWREIADTVLESVDYTNFRDIIVQSAGQTDKARIYAQFHQAMKRQTE